MTTSSEKNIPSPCVNICALDEHDVCMGCYRHGKEISYWGDYSNAQKKIILQFCASRYRGEVIAPLPLKQ